jgi:hypothetical protein
MSVVATTEDPVLMPDYERWEMVPEVLLMSGLELPEVGSVPLLDSHNRESTDDILGTAHDFTVEEDELVCKATFSASDEGEKAMLKAEEGHLKDASVGYTPLKTIYIPEGESLVQNSKSYTGPMNLVTKWRLLELSLTPIGADARAKIRSLLQNKGGQEMPSEIKNVVTNEKPEEVAVNLDAVRKESEEKGRKMELDRQREIKGICQIPGTEELCQKFIDEGRSVSETKDMVLKHLSESKAPVSTSDYDIRAGATQTEKFRDAAVDSLTMRKVAVANPAAGASSLSRMGFVDLARECLAQTGVRTIGMGKEEILRAAFGRSSIGTSIIGRTSVPSMGTSDFDYILANSANKILLQAFAQTRSTFQQWMKIGQLNDFKTYDRVRLSDAPGFDLVPEGGEVKYGALSNTREQIKLYTYAKNLAFTREALINDDLSAFDPFMMYGSAAKRKIEAIAYSPLTDNPTMADTGALFNSTAVTSAGGHANLAGTASDPSASTISDGEMAMWAQAGPNGTELGIRPKFFISGIYHKANIFILLNSMSLPIAQMSSNVANNLRDMDFNGGYVPILSPVFASTNRKWFLATEYTQEPTIEVAFLDGIQNPTVTEFDQSPNTLGKVYQAVIDVAAKALSFRGMYENAGV